MYSLGWYTRSVQNKLLSWKRREVFIYECSRLMRLFSFVRDEQYRFYMYRPGLGSIREYVDLIFSQFYFIFMDVSEEWVAYPRSALSPSSLL